MADINSLISELRQIVDRKSELSEEEKKLNGRKTVIELELCEFARANGLNKLAHDDMTVSIDREAIRANYDPDAWTEIVRWAVASGNEHIVQHRLTDAKVLELFDNGYALPDGLRLGMFTKISPRRT